MSSSEASRFAGMTTNERLFEAALLDEWDAAARARDRSQMVRILTYVDLGEQAEGIADRVLADPSLYGS